MTLRPLALALSFALLGATAHAQVRHQSTTPNGLGGVAINGTPGGLNGFQLNSGLNLQASPYFSPYMGPTSGIPINQLSNGTTFTPYNSGFNAGTASGNPINQGDGFGTGYNDPLQQKVGFRDFPLIGSSNVLVMPSANQGPASHQFKDPSIKSAEFTGRSGDPLKNGYGRGDNRSSAPVNVPGVPTAFDMRGYNSSNAQGFTSFVPGGGFAVGAVSGGYANYPAFGYNGYDSFGFNNGFAPQNGFPLANGGFSNFQNANSANLGQAPANFNGVADDATAVMNGKSAAKKGSRTKSKSKSKRSSSSRGISIN